MLVDGRTNEITAVPKLLRQLDVRGATVSLDAMGCQKKIAQEIHFAGAHYLLALKANHETLHGEVAALFADPEALDSKSPFSPQPPFPSPSVLPLAFSAAFISKAIS